MDSLSKIHAIWLYQRCKIGSSVFSRLLSRFRSVDEIYIASSEDYSEVLTDNEFSLFADKDLTEARALFERCIEKGIQIISYGDESYPRNFEKIKNPPVLLFCLGNIPKFNEKFCVSVVGARKLSDYGAEMCKRISLGISACGGVIVSGMALGIDGIASASAMAASGVSYVFLACGVDICYPKSHSKLYSDIIANGGAVLSEYPPSAPLERTNFSARNRLISSVSDCLFVVEGQLSGGTAISANFAMENSIPVYTLPANVNKNNSELPFDLLRRGAKPVSAAMDIIADFEKEYYTGINPANADKFNDVTLSEIVSQYKLAMKVSADVYDRAFGEEDNSPEWLRSVYKSKKNKYIKKKANKIKSKQIDTDKILFDCGKTAFEIYNKLTDGITMDELSLEGIAFSELSTAVTMLEMHGYVTLLPGGKIKIN